MEAPHKLGQEVFFIPCRGPRRQVFVAGVIIPYSLFPVSSLFTHSLFHCFTLSTASVIQITGSANSPIFGV